jgi:hypothetical protein
LEDSRDPIIEARITKHILRDIEDDDIQTVSWSIDKLQTHILVVKDIRVELSRPAMQILTHYYMFCRDNHRSIDPSRTTKRLWTNLERLTKSHAKLMMRTQAGIIDAVTVVMLVEASWSFGCLAGRVNVMQPSYPIGPSETYIVTVLKKLKLEQLLDEHEWSPPKNESSQFSEESLNQMCGDESQTPIEDSDRLPLNSQMFREIFSTKAIQQPTQHSSSHPSMSQFTSHFLQTPSNTSTQVAEKKKAPLDIYEGEKKKMRHDASENVAAFTQSEGMDEDLDFDFLF